MKKALITGITGQDGSYLAEFLLNKGYEVYGIIRRASTFNTGRINQIYQDPHEKEVRLKLFYGDLSDPFSIYKTLSKVMPDEIYNLASQSHVRVSFDIPEYTTDITAGGVVSLLEAVKHIKETTGHKIKFYQASSSEMFGKVKEIPQTEDTPFHPMSPYACAKVYGYWMTRNYRENYGLFACNGILFNHESPRRGETFVTRKITRAAVRIKEGIQKCLYLGNLDARRDWGYAGDYIEAMWLMLQQNEPDDFVIATGENHTVREFMEWAFRLAGLEIKSNGKQGIKEEYVRTDTGETVIAIDPHYFRAGEVDVLLGNSAKAEEKLKWRPKITFKELINLMVSEDREEMMNELYGSKFKR